MNFDKFCDIFSKYSGDHIVGCFQIYRDLLLKRPSIKVTLSDAAPWGLDQYMILVNDVKALKQHTLEPVEAKEYIKIYLPINHNEIINMSKLERVVKAIEEAFHPNTGAEFIVELYAAFYEVGDNTIYQRMSCQFPPNAI